ncbi:DUF2235 domain-containing protein [Legionella erythra]|uniref:T6SS Phospholipase effector Tle1-like catalytic domain-containing protein n=1 Tax=Legionella erythra TaxID=448 RepID=A0A0W0TSF7_LEGER|nr:DUF2235 domain-containing protein [Legionella erythra]KTC98444.1 hypothetical protein Lery_0912 [Legionella erythra]
MKRIVICCDGTWNLPDTVVNGLPLKTNVTKIAEAVLYDYKGIEQMMFYDTGIGTHGNWFSRVVDGLTGYRLSENMLKAYRFLVQNYDDGDELFLFGFSRGAFTVRTLAGMIRNCGILRRNQIDKIDQGFKLYSARTLSSHPRLVESTLFRRSYAVRDKTAIKFIGVWDTVGALGNPLLLNGIVTPRHRFHDYKLSSMVENAYHAVAINEQRRHFQPALWEKDKNDTHQTLEQVWFVGVHADVGGGYEKTGLSDIALHWIADKARHVGLGLSELSIKPDLMQACANSRTGLYRLIPPYSRPIDKAAGDGKETCESLHPSVLQRYRSDPDYRPVNLLNYLQQNPNLLT